METLLLNICPKNLIPEVPPGTIETMFRNKKITCATAANTVKGVLWRKIAKYNVRIRHRM